MPNKLNASPLAAETSRKEAVRVSDDVACQVVNQEGSLISRVDVAGDLPVPWILRRMEKYLVVSGSRFLCEMPQLRGLLLSAPLCPQLGSRAAWSVRGQRGPSAARIYDPRRPGRAGDLCCKTQAGVGDSVTRSLRNACRMVPPGPLLALSVARPAAPGA